MKNIVHDKPALTQGTIEAATGRLRALQTRNFGFWNASSDEGVWRLVAVWRHGQGSGADHELAAVLSWPNERAQALACEMMGVDGPKLPEMIDAGACHMALSTHAAIWCSSHFDCSWAMATHSAPNEAQRSGTARLIAFERQELIALAAGFELIAKATGGSFALSDPVAAIDSSALAQHCDPLPFEPAKAVRARMEIHSAWDLIDSISPANPDKCMSLDARALARHFGLPAAASLLSPSFGAMDGPMLNKAKIAKLASDLGPQAFTISCHVDPDALGARDQAALISSHQTLQEWSLLREDLGSGAPSRPKPGL